MIDGVYDGGEMPPDGQVYDQMIDDDTLTADVIDENVILSATLNKQ